MSRAGGQQVAELQLEAGDLEAAHEGRAALHGSPGVGPPSLQNLVTGLDGPLTGAPAPFAQARGACGSLQQQFPGSGKMRGRSAGLGCWVGCAC